MSAKGEQVGVFLFFLQNLCATVLIELRLQKQSARKKAAAAPKVRASILISLFHAVIAEATGQRLRSRPQQRLPCRATERR